MAKALMLFSLALLFIISFPPDSASSSRIFAHDDDDHDMTTKRSLVSPTERLIRALNLFPSRAVNIVNDSTIGLDGSFEHGPRLVEKRFKFPNADYSLSSSTDSTPTTGDLGHHAGYFSLKNTYGARMFYFFFESRNNSKQAPVVIWLSGGPGCSSSIALFYENGPFKVNDQLNLVWNTYGWDQASNILFVDQPVGTGFSYTNDSRDFRHDENGISNDLYSFMQAFFAAHPDYAKNDFYITGESYAGHYVPAFASRINEGNRAGKGIKINLKGIAIGNGLTNSGIQYPAYPDFALQTKLIDKSSYNEIMQIVPSCQNAIKLCGTNGTDTCSQALNICEDIFESILQDGPENLNYYDIRKQCEGSLCYDFSNLGRYLSQQSVKTALGVGNIDWIPCSNTVYDNLQDDWMRDLAVGIPALLEQEIQVLIYAGEDDLICNWLGNSRWVHAMEWSGKPKFASASEVPFQVDGSSAGVLTKYGPLSFLKINNAGHMVPMDQPKAALEMLDRFVKGAL
ncbi:hypothetical protein Droror1_Dr00016809 [Drosera rotundifolia]